MEDLSCDVVALQSELSEMLGENVVDVTVLHDGLNLSLGIETATAENAYVLRRPNKFRDSDGFLDTRQEYRVLELLQQTPVPAPSPVMHGDAESVLEGSFLVTTYVDGEPVPLGSRLPERFQHPAARQQFGEVVVESLATLHTLDTEPFRALCAQTSLREQVEAVIGRMESATAETGHEPPAARKVADWLRDNVPPESATAVCHGDFRPGNILFVGEEQPQVGGIIDWETTWLGDPRIDLGYLLLRWRDRGDPRPSVETIAARHPQQDVTDELTGEDTPGIAPYSTKPGSPTRQELVAQYEAKAGIAFEHSRFFRTLAAYDLAAIWESIYREQLDAGQAEAWEPKIEYLLLSAECITRGDYPL